MNFIRILALMATVASSGCYATIAVVSLDKNGVLARENPTKSTSDATKKGTKTDWWVAPVIVVAIVPAMAFDFATFPVQLYFRVKEPDGITR